MPMTRARRALVVLAIAAAACGSAQPPRWSGEVKNSDEHLSAGQRAVLREKLRQLQQWMPDLVPAARTLALLVEDGQPGETAERRAAAQTLADKIRPLFDRDAGLRSVSFISGDFPDLVTVSKTAGFKADFNDVESGLRGQIGFFPEDLHTPIEDPAGYPQPQFTVATRGRTSLRIATPLVAGGIYLGDLIAEYESEDR